MEINEEDEKALAAFMSKDKAAERTLGDIILQKIREKDAVVATGGMLLELLSHNWNCRPFTKPRAILK